MTNLPRPQIISKPLLPLTAAVCGGIVLQHYYRIESAPIVIVGATLALVATAGVLFSLSVKKNTVASGSLIGAFFITGALLAWVGARAPAANRVSRMYEEGLLAPHQPVEVIGIVRGDPEPAPQGLYLQLGVQKLVTNGLEQNASGTVLLSGRMVGEETKREFDALELRHGARIRVMTTLARENDYRNPGVAPFTEYLEREGYDATGTIKSPLLVERLDDETVFPPLAWLYEWRTRLQQEFNQRFSAETAGVLNAALLGNPHNISAGSAERFRAGGTFHILVISGLQIAFIAGVIVLIVRRISRQRWIQFLLSAAFLWAYTIAVGAQTSVARAALMFTFVALAPLVARRSNSLNTIAAAALLLIIYYPPDLFDPSFQLTFLSVLSIICIAVPLMRHMQRVGCWQPTMATPYPPHCPSWFRTISEALFWSERAWRTEMAASNIKHRVFKTRLAAILERRHMQRPLRFAAGAVVVSASVQLGLLPLMILYFHRISIASIVLNIFVGFLMAVMAFAALAAIAMAQLSTTLAAPLITVAERSNWLMVHAVDPFLRFGAASLRLPHYSGWSAALYVFYFVLLLLLIIALGRWDPLGQVKNLDSPGVRVRRHLIAGAATIFVVIFGLAILHPFCAARNDGKLHVDFLDVGQGDSALLTMPDGTTLLVDGGGRPNIDWNDEEGESSFQRDTRRIGERVVSEYLWSRGLDRIDYVIATHADADHIDGLNNVVRNFQVRGALVARTPPNDPGFARFAQSLKDAGVSIELIGSGDSLQIGEVKIDTLWPPQAKKVDAPYRNDDGLVLRIRYGTKTLLFAADIEKETEMALLTSGVDLRSDLIKVAHHGSRTSSIQAFVDATRPAIAVISVGRSSIFGHPHKEVVDRWRAKGARVMTTGEKGTISVVTDGRELNVSTFVP